MWEFTPDNEKSCKCRNGSSVSMLEMARTSKKQAASFSFSCKFHDAGQSLLSTSTTWESQKPPPRWKRTRSYREKYLDWRPQWLKGEEDRPGNGPSSWNRKTLCDTRTARGRPYPKKFSVSQDHEEPRGEILRPILQSKINSCIRIKVLFHPLSHFRKAMGVYQHVLGKSEARTKSPHSTSSCRIQADSPHDGAKPRIEFVIIAFPVLQKKCF